MISVKITRVFVGFNSYELDLLEDLFNPQKNCVAKVNKHCSSTNQKSTIEYFISHILTWFIKVTIDIIAL